MPTLRFMTAVPVVLLFGSLALGGCDGPDPARQADDTPAADRAAQWDALVERFIAEYFEAHPVFAVWMGKHEYDGRLPDWSRAGIEAEIARLERIRAEAETFGDDVLDPQRRYQRDYLVARADRDLFWLRDAEWPFKSPSFYFDWLTDSLDPSPYVTLTYAPPAERLEAVTRYLGNIPQAAEQIRANLATPLPRTYVEYGIASFGGLADYFGNELVAAFAEVEDAALQEAFETARGPAVEAMAGLRTWLEGERATATDDYALGPELFRQMLGGEPEAVFPAAPGGSETPTG